MDEDLANEVISHAGAQDAHTHTHTTHNTHTCTSQDLYALLGADPSGTKKDLKKAYRKQALISHPDKNTDDPNAGTLPAQLGRSRVPRSLPCDVARFSRYKIRQAPASLCVSFG